MAETVKTFVVPTAWMQRRLQQFMSATGSLNSRKQGRSRRGSIQLAGIDGTPQENGTTIVRVHARRVAASRRMSSVFNHADIGKLMKSLTVAAARVK